MSQILRDSVLLNGGPAIFVFCLCSRLHLFLSVASLSSFFRWLFHRVSVFVRVRWCSSSLSFILLWGGRVCGILRGHDPDGGQHVQSSSSVFVCAFCIFV